MSAEFQAPIRLGMVGGGQGALIGAVHRIAARLDGEFELVAAALSSDPERARTSARELGLIPARSYASYHEMAEQEAAREDAIEAVAIVTPNHLHFPVAQAFLQAGFHIICDKPLTSTLGDARQLASMVERSGKLFILTHNYSGYPMVRQAREMVASGELGEIRLVQVEYAQDWLTLPLEKEQQKQAVWRTDPEKSGRGGAIADIGTHAYHLASFVSGLTLESLLADLSSMVPGRRLDDNAQVLLRYSNGARGSLWASQVAPGHENDLKLRVYGSRGGLAWSQSEPNSLWYTPFGEPRRLLTRGGAGTGAAAARVTRIPPGHPEGYLEGFATIYREAAVAIRAAREPAGGAVPGVSYPTLADGIAGMEFIEACVVSSLQGGVWIRLAELPG